MNQLTVLTMSSRDIAELAGKEHKNVCRVIRDLISDRILDAQVEPLMFEELGLDPMGYTQSWTYPQNVRRAIA